MRIISPRELKERYPLKEETKRFIFATRETLKNIFDGKDKRKIILLGPCSIHDLSSALVYSRILKNLSIRLKDQFVIVMRCYFEKSRSEGAWKGLLHDPHLDDTNLLGEGLLMTRKLLMDLANLQLPVVSEFVHPIFAPYFEDLLSWVMIGARTASSPVHRELASSFDFPVGIKNTTDGNIDIVLQAISVANKPHEWLQMDDVGDMTLQKSNGNPYAHLVLRGSESDTNFDPNSVSHAIEKLREKKLLPKVIIDCAHGNCQKRQERQPVAFEVILQQILEGNDSILGWMIESNLFGGNQKIPPNRKELEYGVSITDECISWRETEALLVSAHEKMQNQTSVIA